MARGEGGAELTAGGRSKEAAGGGGGADPEGGGGADPSTGGSSEEIAGGGGVVELTAGGRSDETTVEGGGAEPNDKSGEDKIGGGAVMNGSAEIWISAERGSLSARESRLSRTAAKEEGRGRRLATLAGRRPMGEMTGRGGGAGREDAGGCLALAVADRAALVAAPKNGGREAGVYERGVPVGSIPSPENGMDASMEARKGVAEVGGATGTAEFTLGVVVVATENSALVDGGVAVVMMAVGGLVGSEGGREFGALVWRDRGRGEVDIATMGGRETPAATETLAGSETPPEKMVRGRVWL